MINNLNLKSFHFVALLMGVFFFFFGYWARGSSIPQFFTTVLALIFGGLLTLFVEGFVNGEINKAKSDYEKKESDISTKCKEEEKALRKKIEELEGQIGDDSVYRFAQELEFLSILSQELRGLPYPFPIHKFCIEIRKLQDKRMLDKELEHYPDDAKDREIALAGLKEGFTEKEGYIPFLVLIGEACRSKRALDILEKDRRYEEKNKLAMPLYKDIKAYLKAWLVCSIKNKVIIQIEPFIQTKLEGIESYNGKETYIETIKYIKDIVLKNKAILPYFSTLGSRKIVEYYLQGLIALLEREGESTQTNNTITQSSPPV